MMKTNSRRLWMLLPFNKNSIIISPGEVLKGMATFVVMLLILLGISPYLMAQTSVPYTWKNVVMKGGGYVPGIIYSKAEANLIYARTDVGGAYRWNQANKTWIPLNDDISDFNNLGVHSIAADPSDANRVYMSTGLYTQSWWSNNADFYASNDKGNTWTVTPLPFKLGGNEPGRGSGERLNVDPNKGSILFMGTNKNGLWKSINYGAAWTQVTSFPATEITFVEFDKTTGTTGNATPVIYAGTSNHVATGALVGGIYKSTDGGATWSLLAGQPTALVPKGTEAAQVAVANRIAFGGDYIYITFADGIAPDGDYNILKFIGNGAVFKYNKVTGVWTNITPSLTSQGGYGGISVHPNNPNIAIVSTLARWWPQDDVIITTDGGATWKNTIINTDAWPYTPRAILDNTSAPYTATSKPHWISTLQIDPFNPNNAMFGTGYGVFSTVNLSQAFTGLPVTWKFENDGLEETVPRELISPPAGAPLVSAIADIGGFRHDDLTISPIAGSHNVHAGNTKSIDFAELMPNVMVLAHDGGTMRGSISYNGGTNWNFFSSQPGGATGAGHITISSNGNTIVWSPEGAAVSYSTTGGSSWTTSTGAPTGSYPEADRVNPAVFYSLDALNGDLYRSTNGGVSFTAAYTELPTINSWETSNGKITPIFGKEGHIWVTSGAGGLFYSTNSGTTFTKVADVTSAFNVTAGKAAPGATYPALYIHGSINNVLGLYRSDNMGTSWVKINNAKQEFGGSFTTITGDPRTYGRLYVGTQGRGIVYGDVSGGPVNNNPVAVATGTPTTGTAPLIVTFNAGGSSDPDGDALTFAWAFGDNTTGTGATPSHTYMAAGTYAATVTVSDGKGGSAKATVSIVVTGVPNRNPVAVATATPTTGAAPLIVTFNAGGSSDPDGDALTFAWAFGDNTTGTGATPSHTYTAAGTYAATVTVSDGKGGSAKATVSIVVTGVPNRNPVAVATATPTTGTAPLIVAFNAGGSSDPDGDALTFAWAFGDNTTGTGATPSHTYTAAGTYAATVTVSDGKGGSAKATVSIVVTGIPNRNPVAVATATPTTGTAPLIVTFNASGSSDPDGDALTFAWAFGDNTTGTGATPSHTYTAAGSYTSTVTVSDGKGGSAKASIIITVTGGNTSCAFGAPLATALPSLNASFTKVHKLGTGGPNLSNVTNFTINWDKANNGLWQMSFNTNNGIPTWWLDLRTKSTARFNQAQPDLTFTNSGFPGLDGAYWVAINNGNFVMVSKTGGFTLYFSNSATPPVCNTTIARSGFEEADLLDNVNVYPMPFNNEIYIDLTGRKDVKSLELYSAMGQKLKSVEKEGLNGQKVRLEISQPGKLFILRIQTQNKVIVKSIMRP